MDAGRRLVAAYERLLADAGEPAGLKDAVLAAQTDWLFRVPADRLLETQAGRGSPAFAYRVDLPSPLMGGVLGACHAIDLPLTFGTQAAAKMFVGEGPDVDALATKVGDSWVAFARTGDPATESLPLWPRFDSSRRRTMILDAECHLEELPREAERRLWDGIIA
jgi:para-nitrobenzyl esterase